MMPPLTQSSMQYSLLRTQLHHCTVENGQASAGAMSSRVLRIKAVAALFFHFQLGCFFQSQAKLWGWSFSQFSLLSTIPLHVLAKNTQCTWPKAQGSSFVFEQERLRSCGCRELRNCFLLLWIKKYWKIRSQLFNPAQEEVSIAK